MGQIRGGGRSDMRWKCGDRGGWRLSGVGGGAGRVEGRYGG